MPLLLSLWWECTGYLVGYSMCIDFVTDVINDLVLHSVNPGMLDVGFDSSTTSMNQIALAFYGGLWAYDGW